MALVVANMQQIALDAVSTDSLTVGTTLTVGTDLAVGDDLTVAGDATVTGTLTVTGAINDTTAAELASLDMSSKFTRVDDFYGTWLITDAAQGPGDFWSSTAGAGTGNQLATTIAASLNGEITLKSASDDGTHAQNNSMLTGINLGFKANSGGLAIEARLKIDAITAVYLMVGFTDTISTTVECPIFMLAADMDSDATDAFGVVFDTDATTDTLTFGGVANGTDTTPTISGTAMVAATYMVLRVECSAAGVITAYANGVSLGAAVPAGVTITTALTPCVVIGNRGAAQRIATIDYIKVEQNRIA